VIVSQLVLFASFVRSESRLFFWLRSLCSICYLRCRSLVCLVEFSTRWIHFSAGSSSPVSARGTRPWLRFPTHKVRALACFAARAPGSANILILVPLVHSQFRFHTPKPRCSNLCLDFPLQQVTRRASSRVPSISFSCSLS
jgi:hypothetical protein